MRRVFRTKSRRQGLTRLGLVAAMGFGLFSSLAAATVREGSPSEAAEWVERSGPGADRILRERSQTLLGNPGALLREARRAAAAQDESHAIWLLEQVIQRHPVVADYAALLQMRLMQEQGRSDWVMQVARRALARNPGTPLAPDFHEGLGDALMKEGEGAAAQAAWRRALDESEDEALRSRVLLAIGAAEERAGLDEEAATTYRLLWYAYPTQPEADVAAHRLELLAALLDRPLLDGTAWRRRADRLYRKRHNEEAFEAYDEASRRGVSASETRAIARQKARLLFRLRRYPEAVLAFQALPQQDDVPIWYARSLARADRVPESIEAFERLARTGPASLAPRARFLAATLLEGRDFNERAREHYIVLAQPGRRSSFTNAALWRLGWMAYREKRDREAVGYFDRLIARSRAGQTDQLRARYWRARALERSGSSEGNEALAQLARDFPFSYYGWRAQTRAEGAGSPAPEARRALADSPRRLDPHSFIRPRILIEAGMSEEARAEIARSVTGARGLGDRLELAQLATDAGDYHRAQRLVVDAYSEQLARGPIRRFEDLWWYAWPSAYAPEVGQATESEGSVEPALVYSIMREESGYRPDVISPVGARGLLQIMTPTGEVLAEKQGLEVFVADDLFVPGTNITLGADYLSELSAEFGGRLSASIASYNAGPEAVRGWIPQATVPEEMDDEWVESIPYEQTRNYVKRVLRSLHVYRTLY